MFWLLPIFVLLLQLQTTSSTLVCIKCIQHLNLNLSDGINVTTCTLRSNPSPLCTAVLEINYALTQANVTFDGDSHNFDNVLKGKNMIKHNMEINLHDNTVRRRIQISCFNNESCSHDMKKIYDKSKQLNYTILQNDLKAQLYNSTFPIAQLTCLNNEEQAIPCPNGCCELSSNGKSNFNHKCSEYCSGNDRRVIVEQNVVGETDAESIFTYTCNTPMCNDKTNAEKVRNLLKDRWLLTPAGVGPDPPNTATTVSSQILIIIQCILLITLTSYFKYN